MTELRWDWWCWAWWARWCWPQVLIRGIARILAPWIAGIGAVFGAAVWGPPAACAAVVAGARRTKRQHV